jgi:hypothetical protein
MKVYNMSFKNHASKQFHFDKRPKIQHGVKATSFPRILYVPPPSCRGHNFQRVRTVYSHSHM